MWILRTGSEGIPVAEHPKRIIVGISGASGAPLALKCLELLRAHTDHEIHLILGDGAAPTIQCETHRTVDDIIALAHRHYPLDHIGAGPASGSFQTCGMLIVPCSMKTVAGIASGYADNLLLRAADVTIKEHRKLVLAPRETPLSPIHLRNLHELSQIPWVCLVPPMMTFYNQPESIDDMVFHLAARLLSCFGIDIPGRKMWDSP